MAGAVAGSRTLALAGVESFEGIIDKGESEATLEAVDDLLTQMRAVVAERNAAGYFSQTEEVIVTSGGSAFLDRVVRDLISHGI